VVSELKRVVVFDGRAEAVRFSGPGRFAGETFAGADGGAGTFGGGVGAETAEGGRAATASSDRAELYGCAGSV